MKKYILPLFISSVLSLSFIACSSITTGSITKEQNNTLSIDVDEELSIRESLDELQSSKSIVLDHPIYIGDNDEVAFKGDSIEKKSPLTIQYGQKSAFKFSGKVVTIKTMELKNGENIIIKDNQGNIFIDMKVIKKRTP